MPTRKRAETAPVERRDIDAAAKARVALASAPRSTRTSAPASTPVVRMVVERPEWDVAPVPIGEPLAVPAFCDFIRLEVMDASGPGVVQLHAALTPEELADGMMIHNVETIPGVSHSGAWQRPPAPRPGMSRLPDMNRGENPLRGEVFEGTTHVGPRFPQVVQVLAQSLSRRPWRADVVVEFLRDR